MPLADGWGKLEGDEHDVPGVGDGIIDGDNSRPCRLSGNVKDGTHAGRVALVTGAGRGIGAATARLLAGEGAAVALAARSEEEIISVAREITSRGGTAVPVMMEVADEDSVTSCFERVRADLGDVTILVNNAGTPGVPLPVAATKPESWRRAFDVNVTGAFLCAREALPSMVSANWGRIVNVSSAAARHPVAGMAAYGASKAALDQLTRVLALEAEPYGISVTGVYPGVIDTRMQEESRSFGQDLIGKQLYRMFQGYKDYEMLRPPEEPAQLISYLCTQAATRLNGHIIRLEQLEAIKAHPKFLPRSQRYTRSPDHSTLRPIRPC